MLDLAYDEIGNVTYKSDVGAYVYDATKKHAVVAAGANSYAYDANGAVVNASGTTISWASFDLPTRIVHPSGNYSTFDYGPDRARIRQVARAGGETIETIYAAGGLYERVTRNGATSQRHYIVADGRRVAVLTRAAGSAPTTVYLLEDHLGGVDGFTSESGALLSRASNQPFGARRSGNWVDTSPTSAEWQQVQSTTPRGFTDQEHVDNLGVIHMNGRVYDPVLGRFLSPDPLVQAPYDSQTWNRYSYARNNPLRYTDPSGFCFNGHPAGDINAESCFRSIVQNIIVQMSRLPVMYHGSLSNLGGGGSAAASDFAGAGSVSGADAAFVSAGGTSRCGPGDHRPERGGRRDRTTYCADASDSCRHRPRGIRQPALICGGRTSGRSNHSAGCRGCAALRRSRNGVGQSVSTAFLARWRHCGHRKRRRRRLLFLALPADSVNGPVVRSGSTSPKAMPVTGSTWLTRGPGWEPPYETGLDAASNLALPSYNPGSAVRAVRPPWHKYVRGPRVR